MLNTKFKKFNRKESTSAKQNMAVMKRLQQNKKVIKVRIVWVHRNNRYRMRAPIFSQYKFCLHKMAAM